MILRRYSILIVLCTVLTSTLHSLPLTPEQEQQTLTGIYWLIAGGQCWYTAALRLIAECNRTFEHESLGMRALEPETEARVRQLLDDLQIDPDHTLTLRRFTTTAECDIPAAATSHTIYINQEECESYSDQELRAVLAHEWVHLSEKHATISIPFYLCIPFVAEGIVRGILWTSNYYIQSLESWKLKLACTAVHTACSSVAATGLPTCLLAMSLATSMSCRNEYRADAQAAALHQDNKQGLIQTFKRFIKEDPTSLDSFSLTHPSLRKRMYALGLTAEDEAELDALVQNKNNENTHVQNTSA